MEGTATAAGILFYDHAWPRAEKIAFWINAYNAFTIKAILDNYPIKSGRKAFKEGKFKLSYLDYDWSLNEQPPVQKAE